VMTEEELLSNYRHKAVTPTAGALYFPVSVAREILVDCRRYGLAVVGIEGNRVKDGVVYSRSDLIYDLSRHRASTWTEYASRSNDQAARVLDELQEMPDLVLWLTILAEHEWQL
jgi:hypothetical protein